MYDMKISRQSDEVGRACRKKGRRSPTKDDTSTPREGEEEERQTAL